MMKSDIDALMQARNLDAILILGNATYNPPMTYMTGGGHVNHAVLIKKRNSEGILFCNLMEREEAAKSGLKVVPLPASPLEMFHGEEGIRQCREAGLTQGRVGLFGQADIAETLLILEHLKKAFPALEFVGTSGENSLFQHAMETKDDLEIDRIRKMGKITTDVVRQTADYLTGCKVREDEVLLKEDGTPLSVGDMHSKIRLWVAEHGAELPAGLIFSTGHDAGVPHSVGTPEALMRLGQTIIFDIYPAEAGGGYFYDFTRTWSLGYASPETQSLYDQVKEIYDRLSDNFDLNGTFKSYETMVCDYFESKGHKTKRTNPPAPLEGYVHSLGHGVGLNIHERPQSAFSKGDDNILKPGVVVTSEPGLYYPDQGMGFRIEDTYCMKPDGTMERLAEYPYDFVLPMKMWKKK
jgi:Xaa-Pro aminopeptidase